VIVPLTPELVAQIEAATKTDGFTRLVAVLLQVTQDLPEAAALQVGLEALARAHGAREGIVLLQAEAKPTALVAVRTDVACLHGAVTEWTERLVDIQAEQLMSGCPPTVAHCAARET